MSIEYHTSISQRTWTVESGNPGKTITCGFGIKETIDRPLGSDQKGNGTGTYKYMPLSERTNIRLLHLLPGQGSDPLRGWLAENKSTIEGYTDPYEAVSYVWGDSTKQAAMLLDESEFLITRSLEAALLHLRSSQTTATLWIDAICINQANDEERGSQVQQMYEVYNKAERVHVWLGTSNDNSGVGMMVLQQLCHDLQLAGDPLWKDLTPNTVRAGVKDIMDRHWFSRVWVVQEAAVAKNVTMHCGYHQFSWRSSTRQVRTFSRAIKAAVLSPAWAQTELSSVSMEAFLQMLQRQLENGPEGVAYKANLPPYDLLDVAYGMRDRKCTDPRDRIFAMLGFADDETRKKLQPDYCMRMEDLYRKFEEVLLSRGSKWNPVEQEAPENGTNMSGTAQSNLAEPRDDLEECWEIVNRSAESDHEKNLSGVSKRKCPWDITRSAFTSGGQRMRTFWSSFGVMGQSQRH